MPAFLIPAIPVAAKYAIVGGAFVLGQAYLLYQAFCLIRRIDVDGTKEFYPSPSSYPVRPGVYSYWDSTLNEYVNIKGNTYNFTEILVNHKRQEGHCDHTKRDGLQICFIINSLEFKVTRDIYETDPIECDKPSCNVWSYFEIDPFQSELFSDEEEFTKYTGMKTIFDAYRYKNYEQRCKEDVKKRWFQPVHVRLNATVVYMNDDKQDPDPKRNITIMIFPLKYNDDLLGFEGSR